MVIDYLLFPNLLYKNKYLLFFVSFGLLLAVTIGIEELVIEKIYFPETRGKRFPGIFYSLLDVMPVILILSSFKYAWDTIRKLGELEEIKVSLVENELKYLKSQVNPHFLFNNLNNLYAYALENSPKTPLIILELSSVLRYMLYDCKEKYVPVANEISHLENFSKLNELQIEERGKVILTVPESFNSSFKIAPLILIVFVENAFKHSTMSQSSGIMIDISITLSDDGLLKLKCSNSYLDQLAQSEIKGGIGLENVKKRLEYLYPGTHRLTINQEPNLFHIDLELNIGNTI